MKKMNLIFLFSLLLSCTVTYDDHNGFKIKHLYESRIDLYIDGEKPHLVSLLREIEKDKHNNIFPAGQKLVIKNIYRTYPNTSGITIVKADVLTGKFKGETIILSSSLSVSYFIEVENSSK